MDEYDRGFDNGYRAGTFDKCNGKPRDVVVVDTDYAQGYIDGYDDGYDSNDVRIAA